MFDNANPSRVTSRSRERIGFIGQEVVKAPIGHYGRMVRVTARSSARFGPIPAQMNHRESRRLAFVAAEYVVGPQAKADHFNGLSIKQVAGRKLDSKLPL